MTHSGHRIGNRASLLGDWVLLARMPYDYPSDIQAKMKTLVRICARHNPVCISSYNREGRVIRYMRGWEENQVSGVHISSTIEEVTDDPILQHHAVYAHKEDILNVVREINGAELGIPIVIAGQFDEVFNICKTIETEPHTVNLCARTLGKLELLPEPPILKLVTMCGHGRVSSNLARHLIDKVRKGMMTPEEASLELGKQCTCNILNPVRGAKIILDALSG